MEGLAPPLKCLIEIQSCIHNGETVRSGLVRYLQSQSQSLTPHPVRHQSGLLSAPFAMRRAQNNFAADVRRFLFAWDQGHDWKAIVAQTKSPQRRALLDLVAIGLAGQPVQSHLEDLKLEIMEACDSDIRHHLEILPVLMLAPLLLFQFPAFLLLLFGPLLNQLIQELSR